MTNSKKSEILAARVLMQLAERSGTLPSDSVRKRALEALRRAPVTKQHRSGSTLGKKIAKPAPREEVVDMRTRQVINTPSSAFQPKSGAENSKFNAS